MIKIISLLIVIVLVKSASLSQKTSLSQLLVSGLTQLFAGFDAVSMNNDDAYKRQYKKAILTTDEVSAGIRRDFVNGYLFSGSIDSEIYSENCVFTDPTLSFKGLTRFEKNIRAIKPLIDVFINDSLLCLYDLQETNYYDDDNNEKFAIKARWRMSGGIRLPWNPRIELTGQTRYTLDIANDNRIIDYFETWNLPASVALGQLLRTSPRKTKFLVNNENIKAIDVISTKMELLLLTKKSKTVERDSDIRELVSKLKLVRSSGELTGDKMSLFDKDKSLNKGKINTETFLKNTKWNLLYCSKMNFNPYNSKITQEFVELHNNDTMIELCLTSSQLLGLSFIIISKIEIDKNDSDKINVTYQQKLLSLSLLGNDINLLSQSIDKNKGVWTKLYEDNDMRIFENDNKNIFVLGLLQ